MESLDLRALFDRGCAGWPALSLERAVFDRRVEELAAAQGEAPQLEHAGDLYLACACASGVRGAAEAFDAAFKATILRAIEQIDRSSDFVTEATQAVRIRLFMSNPPKIAAYAGRAKMSTWLTTVARRTALNLRASRGQRVQETLREQDEHPIPLAAVVERDLVRSRYRKVVEQAVEAATSRLTSRERTLLRLHLGERMSIDRLATAYGVGRSTAARWIVAARDKLIEEAREELEKRLGVSPSELVEVGADVKSVLEVSLVRLLQSAHAKT